MTSTIIERLEPLVERGPDKIFSVFYHGHAKHAISYRDIWRRSHHFAERLAAVRLSRGDVVAIMLRHTPDLYYAFLGTIMAGAIPTFMPHPNPKQEERYFWASHRELFKLSRISTLITYPELTDAAIRELDDTLQVIVAGEDAPLSLGFLPRPLPAAGGNDIAVLQHSSGTTGLKKGVILSHSIILHHIDTYAATLGFGADDVVASWLPLYHDMGLMTSFLMPLLTGAKVIALDSFDWVSRPSRLLDVIAEYRATFCWLPNFAFHHIESTARQQDRYDLSSIRALINCSEPCRADTFDGFVSRFSSSGVKAEQLQVCYGMAENVFAVTQTPRGSMPRWILANRVALETRGAFLESNENVGAVPYLSCGRVINGSQVRIVDENRVPVGEDVVGEIAISGNYLFRGYFKRPDATEERVSDEWYYSGDLGFFHDDELYITGRKDDLLILYGRNVYAHEIEACLAGCPGVVPGRAIALGLDNARSGSRDLVVVAEVEDDVAAPELQRRVKRRILDQLGLSVARVATVERGWLAKSTSGKIARRLNQERYQKMLASRHEHP